MIEPATLMKGARIEKAQRSTCSLNRLTARNPVAIRCDAKSCQTKTSRRDACHVSMAFRQRYTVHSCAIGHQSCIWIRLFPEVTERALLKVIDKCVGRACRSTGEKDKNNDSKAKFADTFYLSTTSNFASSTSRELDPTITRNSPGSTTKRISRFQNAS